MRNSVLRILLCAHLFIFAISLCAQNTDSRFDWSASAAINSNYIWRGLYCGGLSFQADATVSYAGIFANMWWNVGATDWTFQHLNPEVDLSIGFSRWGLSVYYIHMYYFDHYADGTRSRFFDMHNYVPGGGGTTGEWRIAYRISDKIPLSMLLATRTFGRDGYIDQQGNLRRAYSTYIELGYDFTWGKNWLLATRLGMTPAKSLYTAYQGNFAICHIGLNLQKTWSFPTSSKLSSNLTAFANLMLNPYQVNKNNLILPIEQAGNQKLNLNMGCQVVL